MKNIYVVGSFNIDSFFRLPRVPFQGETVISEGYYQTIGGKGFNQAIAAARQNVTTFYIGNIGNGITKEEITKKINTPLLNMAGAVKSNHPTGQAVIYNIGADNMIVVAEEANVHLSNADVFAGLKNAQPGDILITQLGINPSTAFYALEYAKKKHMVTILNPAPIRNMPNEVFDKIDYFIPNELESKQLSGGLETKEAISYFKEKGVKEVIVTLGAKGVAYISNGALRKHPAEKVAVVDTTAAGDTFIGVFASAMARGWQMEEAISEANIAASITVSKLGTLDAIPYLFDMKAIK